MLCVGLYDIKWQGLYDIKWGVALYHEVVSVVLEVSWMVKEPWVLALG